MTHGSYLTVIPQAVTLVGITRRVEMRMNSANQSDTILQVEHVLQLVPDDAPTDKVSGQFRIWCGANIAPINWILGAGRRRRSGRSRRVTHARSAHLGHSPRHPARTAVRAGWVRA